MHARTHHRVRGCPRRAVAPWQQRGQQPASSHTDPQRAAPAQRRDDVLRRIDRLTTDERSLEPATDLEHRDACDSRRRATRCPSTEVHAVFRSMHRANAAAPDDVPAKMEPALHGFEVGRYKMNSVAPVYSRWRRELVA